MDLQTNLQRRPADDIAQNTHYETTSIVGGFTQLHSDEAIAVRKGSCGGARRHAELVEDIAQVAIYGPAAQRQVPGDRLIGPTSGNVTEYFEFARR